MVEKLLTEAHRCIKFQGKNNNNFKQKSVTKKTASSAENYEQIISQFNFDKLKRIILCRKLANFFLSFNFSLSSKNGRKSEKLSN